MDAVITFFNSSFFVSLVTMGTALVAWLVYRSKLSSDKVQAARVLVTEIRIAEERLDKMRDNMTDNILGYSTPIFPTKSWKVYSHLFISDFDQDELKLLNSFYDYGELAEEYAKKDNNFFWVATEERAKVSVRKVADFITEAINQGSDDPDGKSIQNKKTRLDSLLDKHSLLYTPAKSVNEIKKLLPNIPKITTSSCGPKLKKLAKLAP